MKGNAELVDAIKKAIVNAPTSAKMEKRFHELLATILPILEEMASDAPKLWVCVGELIADEGAYRLVDKITPDYWEE